jgi:hypothetical protein
MTLSLLGIIAGASAISMWSFGRSHRRFESIRSGPWDVVKVWIEARTQIALERERQAMRLEVMNIISTMPCDTSIIERANDFRLISRQRHPSE